MKIAICDDCQEDIDELKRLIVQSRYCPSYWECCEFHSGKELLESKVSFDAVFLDIQMEEMKGNTVGERLRERDANVMILFYTGYDMNASQIFKCRPQGYLMKDAGQKELMRNLDSVLEDLCSKKERKLPIACDGKAFVLDLSDILYISIKNKGTEFWLTQQAAERLGISSKTFGGARIKSPVKLNEYYQKLKDQGFISGHNSYIINAHHVEARQNDVVYLSDGQQLTLSRSRKRSFDKDFGCYWSVCCSRERPEQHGD